MFKNINAPDYERSKAAIVSLKFDSSIRMNETGSGKKNTMRRCALYVKKEEQGDLITFLLCFPTEMKEPKKKKTRKKKHPTHLKTKVCMKFQSHFHQAPPTKQSLSNTIEKLG